MRLPKTRTILILIVSGLVISGGVAAYTGSKVVVGSIHTTDSDFQAGELTNMTIVGSDDSASLSLASEYLDDFEDNDTNIEETNYDGWNVIESGPTFTTTKTNAINGTYSSVYEPSDDDNTQTVEFTRDTNTTKRLEYNTIVKEDSDLNPITEFRFNSGKDQLGAVQFNEDFNRIDWYNGSATKKIADWDTSASNVQRINLTWDFAADTVTVTINGNTTSNLDLANSASGWDTVQQETETGGLAGLDIKVYTDNWQVGDVGGLNRGNYISTNHTVEQSEQAFVNITNINNATANMTWLTGTDSVLAAQNYTTTGNKSLTWPAESEEKVYLNLTVYNNSTNGAPSFTMADEGVLFNNFAPEIDNSSATPTGDLTQPDNTFEIDINDSTFNLSQGDTVTAELYIDGSLEGTDSLTSNGSASVSATVTEGGDHTYHWETNDSYGGESNSDTFTISVPSKLYIYNETPPHDLLNGTNISIDGVLTGSNETVRIEQNVTDGTIDFSGLPSDESYVISLDSNQHYVREVYVESIFDQQAIFLLDKNESAVENEITITDRTGRFDESPIIIIQRVINTTEVANLTDEGDEWTPIGGDRLGAGGSYIIDLQQNSRYRFIVKNVEGDTRVLSEYTAKTDGTVDLEIGEIQYDLGPSGQLYQWSAEIENESSGGGSITFAYNDQADLTENLTVTISYRNNSTVVTKQEFTNGPYGEITYTETISQDAYENESFIVEFSAKRDGEIISGKRVVGSKQPIGLPLDAQWVNIMFAAVSLILAFLVGAGISPGAGGITVAGWAGVGWYIGIVPQELGAGAIILAMAIGIWTTIREDQTGVPG